MKTPKEWLAIFCGEISISEDTISAIQADAREEMVEREKVKPLIAVCKELIRQRKIEQSSWPLERMLDDIEKALETAKELGL